MCLLYATYMPTIKISKKSKLNENRKFDAQ